MPINLLWQPSSRPPTNDTPDQLGLELGGDEPTIAPATAGRVKLFEVPDPSAQGGTTEAQQPRLIATFHGKFFYDAKSPPQTRVTFDILVKAGTTHPAFDPNVEGFDPECMFGVDAIVLTFVNRRFVIFLPFYVDSRSEGKFLDVQAIAETDAGTGTRELGKSAVLSLGIRRTHAVDTTTTVVGGGRLSYTSKLVGNLVLCQEEFLLDGQVRDPKQSTPTEIVLMPKLVPIPAAGAGGVTFQAYVAGSMTVLLADNLLDGLTPSATAVSTAVPTIGNGAAAEVVHARGLLRFGIAKVLTGVLTDAGFAGAVVGWEGGVTVAALQAAFTAAFSHSTLGGDRWQLRNANQPFVTSFWNHVVTHDAGLPAAGVAEQRQVDVNAPHAIGGQNVFLNYPVPIGSGNKRVVQTTRINGGTFRDLLLFSGGVARQFKTPAEFDTAVEKTAAHVALAIAHEVGHALGIMHTCHVEPTGNYSEAAGSPVLTINSEGMDGGGFGSDMKFSSQVKVIWADAFRTTPTFADGSLRNKTWTAAEVPTLGWFDRQNRFLRQHGEPGMRKPGWVNGSGTPPFAKVAPAAQKGTKI